MAFRDRIPAVTLAGAVLVAITAWWVGRVSPEAPPAATASIPPEPSEPPPAPAIDGGRGSTLLAEALKALGPGRGAADVRPTLGTLAADLGGLGRDPAVAAITDFLARGSDAPTGMGFALGHDGQLTEAPSLRVFLLDLLERLDPAAAAAQARALLGTSGSADEWAVALRSLARGGPGDRSLLASRFRELLNREEWRRAPSAGWLESFDVAVHLGGTAFIPELTSLMQPVQGRTVNHAAFLALDRLVAREPVPLLTELLDQPSTLAGREASRAGMFARADVRDPAQRALVERYLLDPARPVAELDAFAGVYPNANSFVSPNLLTPARGLPANFDIDHDMAAIAVVRGWKADRRFARVIPQLGRIEARLGEFVRQSAPPGN